MYLCVIVFRSSDGEKYFQTVGNLPVGISMWNVIALMRNWGKEPIEAFNATFRDK